MNFRCKGSRLLSKKRSEVKDGGEGKGVGQPIKHESVNIKFIPVKTWHVQDVHHGDGTQLAFKERSNVGEKSMQNNVLLAKQAGAHKSN